ncbi:DUF2892 domain-containing protein [Paenibacillus filicis]|uniref:DUF2892 domain-containing protein n=1 Tax=Paenibacillus filicis TaxID=669464 RepID=A0ABU9DU19_9BACL
MNPNVGGADRVIRVVLGLGFLSLFILLPGLWKLAGLPGFILLFTALTRRCQINRLLGINSCRISGKR